jgi:NADPH:quinone reductase-like Zn-dependent oxidoreductase
MKAIVYTQYGSPDELRLAEVTKPSPADDDVLVKVRAVGLNAADWRMLRADPFLVRFSNGLLAPKRTILGADIAGTVAATGAGVTQLRPGDAVFVELSVNRFGGLAEFACVPQRAPAPKPANLSFEEAAAVPMGALTALQGLRDAGKIQPGQKVLIHGASGGVGTFAVQFAREFGAEVTAVCSTSKVDQARALGADHVIDYTREDFAKGGRQYDLILGVNGNRSLSDYERALTPTGIYVMAGGATSQMFQAILLGRLKTRPGGKTMRFVSAHASQTDLLFIKELIEAGRIKPVMDRCYPLEQTAEAFRYLEAGHAKGKVVITVAAA